MQAVRSAEAERVESAPLLIFDRARGPIFHTRMTFLAGVWPRARTDRVAAARAENRRSFLCHSRGECQ